MPSLENDFLQASFQTNSSSKSETTGTEDLANGLESSSSSKPSDGESDAEALEANSTKEVRRSGRARRKTKSLNLSSTKKERAAKRAKAKGIETPKDEDLVLLEDPEELLPPERLQITDVLTEVKAQKLLDPLFKDNLDVPQLESEVPGLSTSIETLPVQNSSEAANEKVIETESIEDAAKKKIQKAIEEWYDIVSKKSEDEIEDEVERIMKKNQILQLRPNAKKANISSKAEERFQEHVFEKAKLRKRRISEDDEEDNDLYIPSQPKLYKKAFVVEEIREMEIDRWGEDYYLVKWEDWPEERNTWEPALHLDNCDMVISKFRRRLKQMPEYKTARSLQLKALQAFSDKLFDSRCLNVPRIEVINDVDLTTPNDNFEYRGKLNWPKNRVPISICCDCDECGDNCPCATIDGHKFAYKEDGSLKVLTGNPIYECSTGCKCSLESCKNRVVQRGRTVRMQLFKTPNGRGWGLRALDPIKKNTFVVEYVGEVLPFSEAETRGMVYDARGRTYLFDMDFFQKPGEYTIDAMKSGNEARYFNHSCNPNLFSMCVWYNSIDPFYHHVAFFAKSDISAGKELTINYKNAGLTYRHHLDDQDKNNNENEEEDKSSESSSGENAKEKVPCRCSKSCTEYLFVD